jgi:hypothetical protein
MPEKTTNYHRTFIAVAEDCPATAGEVPQPRAGAPTVASLQFALLADHPYELTSDDLLFRVHALRHGIPAERLAEERARFFARSQACLRASPLAKRHGWGFHFDADGKVALVPAGSEEYRRLASDPALTQLKAMRSKRA